ncbi:hypothetical protein [Luteimonas rhizosphaerae]|uniref:hypothetical protein n=1 Tax=Luteimonas sp. 4-12 TaxID=2027406 RepID=UPI000C7D5406|nr:hypothetical protein [Luteimonas sp. 4-12]
MATLLAALLTPAAQAQAPYSRFDEAPLEAEPSPDPDGAASRASQAYLQRTAAALADGGDSRELAFAATLRRLALAPPDDGDPSSETPSSAAPDDAQAAAWRRRAADTAGSDVVALALATQGEPDADRQLRLAARWLAADPDNLAPLLFRGGTADTLLRDARASRRFDLQMLPQIRVMQAALLRHPPTAAERDALGDASGGDAAEQAAMTAAGLWSAVAIPSLQLLTQACDPARLRDATRLQDCRHVATLLADASDTQLGRGLGLMLLDQTAGTADERARAQAARRTLDWQMLEWGRAVQAQPRDGAPQFVRLLADPSVRSEPDLILRVLQDAGIAPTPPAGWQPPR